MNNGDANSPETTAGPRTTTTHDQEIQETDSPSPSSENGGAISARAAYDAVEATSEAPSLVQRAIGDAVQTILNRLEDVCNQASSLQQTAERIVRQQEFFPPQLRQLSSKVDDVATSISEPRLRDLLKSLLLFHDLLDQMMRSAASESDPIVHQRNYEVLRSQILQTLQLNGVEPIPTDCAFDPNLHKAIKTVPTTDSTADGNIVELFRKGFRSQRMVLRYAEVAIGKYESPVSVVESTNPSEPSDVPN
ncbi:MAG: nucleotide exchange factor GrpE [Deltaproteobacteria bacterium]|nr:nucleotide exchange factor GrpE [Deltaproteobacteria bacterium]